MNELTFIRLVAKISLQISLATSQVLQILVSIQAHPQHKSCGPCNTEWDAMGCYNAQESFGVL
jgi:hypothetical protein